MLIFAQVHFRMYLAATCTCLRMNLVVRNHVFGFCDTVYSNLVLEMKVRTCKSFSSCADPEGAGVHESGPSPWKSTNLWDFLAIPARIP